MFAMTWNELFKNHGVVRLHVDPEIIGEVEELLGALADRVAEVKDAKATYENFEQFNPFGFKEPVVYLPNLFAKTAKDWEFFGDPEPTEAVEADGIYYGGMGRLSIVLETMRTYLPKLLRRSRPSGTLVFTHSSAALDNKTHPESPWAGAAKTVYCDQHLNFLTDFVGTIKRLSSGDLGLTVVRDKFGPTGLLYHLVEADTVPVATWYELMGRPDAMQCLADGITRDAVVAQFLENDLPGQWLDRLPMFSDAAPQILGAATSSIIYLDETGKLACHCTNPNSAPKKFYIA